MSRVFKGKAPGVGEKGKERGGVKTNAKEREREKEGTCILLVADTPVKPKHKIEITTKAKSKWSANLVSHSHNIEERDEDEDEETVWDLPTSTSRTTIMFGFPHLMPDDAHKGTPVKKRSTRT